MAKYDPEGGEGLFYEI